MTGSKPQKKNYLDQFMTDSPRPGAIPRSNYLSQFMDPEDTYDADPEVEQKKRRDALLNRWGLDKENPLAAVVDLGYSTAQDIGQIIKDPASIGRGIESGVSGLGQLFRHPIDAGLGVVTGILHSALNVGEVLAEGLPGVDRLSGDEQMQKTKQAMVDVTATLLGAKLSTLAVGGELPAGSKALLAARSEAELATAFGKMAPEAQAEFFRTQLPTSVIKSIKNGAIGGVAGAAPTGFLYGDTPEERFTNAIQFGALAAVVGGVHGGFGSGRNAKIQANLENIKSTIAESRSTGFAGTVPEEFAQLPKTEAETLAGATKAKIKSTDVDGQPIEIPVLDADGVRKMLKANAPDVQTVFTDLPAMDGLEDEIIGKGKKARASILVHTKADGSKIALVAPEGQTLDLNQSQQNQFRTHGAYSGQAIEWGGKKYRVSDDPRPFYKGAVQLVDENGVKTNHRIPIKDIVYRADQLDHAAYKTQATLDITKDLNKVRRKLEPLEQSQEIKRQAGIDIDPEVQKDIVKHKANIKYLESELNRVATSTPVTPQYISNVKAVTDLGLDHETTTNLLTWFDEMRDYKTEQVKNISDRSSMAGYEMRYRGGKIELYDPATKETPYKFGSPKEVDAFIGSLIASPSGELVGFDPGIATEIKGSQLRQSSPTRLERVWAAISVSAIGRKGIEPFNLFKDLDTLLGTSYTGHFVNLQKAGRIAVHTIIEPGRQTLSPVLKAIQEDPKLNSGNIIDYLTAADHAELSGSDPKTRLLRGRDVNITEKMDASDLVAKVKDEEGLVNLGKMIYKSMEISKHNKEATVSYIKDQFVKQSKKILDADQISAGLALLDRLEEFKGRPAAYSMLAPIKLARAQLTNAVSKAEYAKLAGWTPETIARVEKLRDWYEQTGDLIGVDKKERYNHYFNRHFVDNDPSNLKTPEGIRHVYDNPDLDYALHDLGVRGDYVTDDIVYSALSYLHGGARRNILAPAIKIFKENVVNDLASDTHTYKNSLGRTVKAGGEFARLAETHLNEFQHFASPDAIAAEYISKELAKRIGVDVPTFERVAQKFTGLISSTTMGGNPMMGVRDFASMVQMLYFRFGAKQVKRMFEIDDRLMNKRFKASLTDEIKSEGYVPGKLSRFMTRTIDDPVPGWQSIAQKATAKMGEVGFALTAQEQVYESMHRMVFNERISTYTKSLNDFVKDKDMKKFEKSLDLKGYSTPIQNEFRRLFNTEQYKEAGEWLGMSSGWEALGVYGQANYPIGWSGGTGRLFGQFGKYPIWAMRQLSQAAVTADKGRMARWGASTALLYGAGATLGLNLSSWIMTPYHQVYTGGPAFDVAKDIVYGIGSNDSKQRDLSLRNLMAKLPYNPLDDEWSVKQLKQIYSPIPFSIWNLLEAAGATDRSELMNQVYWENPALQMAKALGFSVAPWHELLGAVSVNATAKMAQRTPTQQAFDINY